MEGRSNFHIQGGRYIKDIVYAANDGIITTFAVVAGVVGAEQALSIVVIMGLANLVADGISMASGNYLGSRSEYLFYQAEKEYFANLVKHHPAKSKQMLRSVYSRKGFRGSFLTELIERIMSKQSIWTDELVIDNLGTRPTEASQPLKAALVTFISFIGFGFVPLVPYLLGSNPNNFLISIIGTGSTLFLVGSLRSLVTNRSWLAAGFEMLLVGTLAGTSAYIVGSVIMVLVS
ncbi:VIT1/CCC1 transporter family protein [Candidatus Berkelbacteria bacterium]|nr:VIT1/CCC1 transporter family protein [Candidatus Berkelbacteria bacterium]